MVNKIVFPYYIVFWFQQELIICICYSLSLRGLWKWKESNNTSCNYAGFPIMNLAEAYASTKAHPNFATPISWHASTQINKTRANVNLNLQDLFLYQVKTSLLDYFNMVVCCLFFSLRDIQHFHCLVYSYCIGFFFIDQQIRVVSCKSKLKCLNLSWVYWGYLNWQECIQ